MMSVEVALFLNDEEEEGKEREGDKKRKEHGRKQPHAMSHSFVAFLFGQAFLSRHYASQCSK